MNSRNFHDTLQTWHRTPSSLFLCIEKEFKRLSDHSEYLLPCNVVDCLPTSRIPVGRQICENSTWTKRSLTPQLFGFQDKTRKNQTNDHVLLETAHVLKNLLRTRPTCCEHIMIMHTFSKKQRRKLGQIMSLFFVLFWTPNLVDSDVLWASGTWRRTHQWYSCFCSWLRVLFLLHNSGFFLGCPTRRLRQFLSLQARDTFVVCQTGTHTSSRDDSLSHWPCYSKSCSLNSQL